VTASLPQDVQDTIAEALPIYEELYARALRPAQVGAAASAAASGAPRGHAATAEANGVGNGHGDVGGWPPPPHASFSPCCRVLCADPAKVTGTFLLLLSVFIWVCQAELLQTIAVESWSKPYFQAASLKSVWVLTLPIWYALTQFNATWQDEITFRRPLRPSCRVVAFSLGLMVLVQSSSATWIASLTMTSVSINSAIYNVNPLLVYVFSIPLLKESCSFTKTSAVLLAMLGTSVVAVGDAHDEDRSLLPASKEMALTGNFLVLVSASLFALKEVLFKRHFASVSVSLTPFTDALLVVGLIGAGSLATLAPVTALLHYTGMEEFEMPTVDVARGYGMVALLMALYQACLLAAIALTTPTFVAMGTILAIPASVAFDYVFRGYLVPLLSVIGMLVLLFAFCVLIFSNSVDRCLAQQTEVCAKVAPCHASAKAGEGGEKGSGRGERGAMQDCLSGKRELV